MTSVRALLSAFALLLQLLPSCAVNPPCKAIWVFKLPCTEPASALVRQVKAWGKRRCYESQEKCSYAVMSESPTGLEIERKSLSTHKTTVMNFEFNPPAAPSFCKMRGVSTTKNSTGPNDYCLLRNLIDESGLTEAEGYKEICNDAMCPARQSATCINEG